MAREAVYLAILIALVALAWALFAAFGADYLAFWRSSGPVIGLATAAIGWAWHGGLDKNPGLVSASPRIYCAAAGQMAGLPIYVFGGHMNHHRHGRAAEVFAILLLTPLLIAAIVGWLLFIAPAQYFAFLLFGAPSRLALASPYRVYAHLDRDGQLKYQPEKPPDDPDGWWDASMRDKPVTVAAGFLAAGIFVIDRLLELW